MKDERLSAYLSRRENDVVDLLMLGKSNKQIALQLGISERTVEFHLNNVYSKLQVGSRMELVLKLVESTVDIGGESIHNGNQPARPGAANSWRDVFSLIKKEVAMTIQISFEELENHLRSRPIFFSALLLLAISLTMRYVLFELGLFFWASYLLLGLSLGAGSVYFGLSWKKLADGTFHISPLTLLVVYTLLPLIAAVFDLAYLQTILRFTEPISITIGNLSAQAGWLMAPDGHSRLFRARQTGSDEIWLWMIAGMLLLFILSFMAGKQFKKNDLATA